MRDCFDFATASVTLSTRRVVKIKAAPAYDDLYGALVKVALLRCRKAFILASPFGRGGSEGDGEGIRLVYGNLYGAWL